MYSQVFGGNGPELISEFDRESINAIDEFDDEIMEAPIDKPYLFCDQVKNSNGQEK